EEIARMVRYHGRPAFLLDRGEPAHEVVRMSWYVSNRLLHLFALADTRGRTTAETTRPEENVHLWKMISEEQGCFDQPYPFANDHARFSFFRQREPNLHYVPHEDYSCTAVVTSGLPGSGKDRWLSQYQPTMPVVSLDDVREELGVDPTENQGQVIQAARQQCREFLRSKTSFAFNATNIVRQARRQWVDLFTDYRARIEMVYVEPPLDVILSQNSARPRPVPESVIHRLVDKTDVPTWAECHGLTIVE
ncbi:MAG: AAA family ATPase, partial [Planctomycetales bacterium]|nr:AAA family ATPase [Planctomycetales bacterium]